MKSPKISVVIPSYNKVKYIKKTLDSIFDQEYQNLEVIVQDGGSTDGTVEIIKKYKNIILESKKDGGQLSAINKGLKRATGDILTFINADDYYEPNTFKLIANLYQNNPEALWFAGYGKMIDENENEVAKFWTVCKNVLLRINLYFVLLMTSNYFMQPSVFITRKAYEKFKPFTGVKRYVFEYEMWLKIGKKTMPTIIPKYLSSFRIGRTNMSSVYFEDLFKKDIEVAKRYSGNLAVFLHKVNNYFRMLSIKIINK